MFHKKTLGAAIAVALSFGVTAAQAASFDKYYFSTAQQADGVAPGSLTSGHQLKKALDYAYEQFGSTDSGALSYPFRVRYTLTKAIPNTFDFYITFTLSGNAQWGSNLGASNLTIQDSAGSTAASLVPISIVDKGKSTESSVSFLVNSSKGNMDPTQILDFNFKLRNVQEALKTPGGQISITATLIIAQTYKDFVTGTAADQQLSTALATSSEGVEVKFSGPEDNNPAYISVVTDGKTFEGPGADSDTMVKYGYLSLTPKDALDKDTPCVSGADYLVSATVGCNNLTWVPAFDADAGYLLIQDGNFGASGVASEGNVYVATTSSATTPKIPATEFTNGGVIAKWTFVKEDLDAVVENSEAAKDSDIVLTVKGDTEIAENRQTQPTGTLVVNFEGGNTVTSTAFLRHLKKNGTVCTLYNIPPSDALDSVNIRITNDSPTVDGFVKGKLRDANGTQLFQKTLIELGSLKPHQTVRLTLDDLKGGGETWKGRAVLTLESNIPHPLMQVFGLLRAIEAQGFPETPLMNMSTGATGNSCD
jgi:hypothetical protein